MSKITTLNYTDIYHKYDGMRLDTAVPQVIAELVEKINEIIEALNERYVI